MGNCPAFSRCVLFHFYIKPQLSHNTCSIIFCCVLFHFYIKPQRLLAAWPSGWRCVLFHFYIKPQLCFVCHKFEFVVSYSISTSNHNSFYDNSCLYALCLIPFLHQTTTCSALSRSSSRCVLFHFYIKPQRWVSPLFASTVVSYSISTSNHNTSYERNRKGRLCLIPFLHQTTTNHRSCSLFRGLCLIPFLHQTTTI